MTTPSDVKAARNLCREKMQAALDEFRATTGFSIHGIYVTDARNGSGEIEMQAVTVEVKL